MPTGGLRQVKAAHLRARLSRKATGQMSLAMLFLMGALSFAYGPQRTERHAPAWMAFLCLLSTFHVSTGARLFFRSKGLPAPVALAIPIVWGGLLLALLWGLRRV
jgi:uncharacterized membrane protein YhdT